MGDFRYKAFISYTHRDETWARWLQHALEAYRIPKRLVGTDGEFGHIPKRLTPVFRDVEDLSSSANLSDSVINALKAAESLIVICSPVAVQARWVDEEIRQFRLLGREDRIYALIVDGDPQSSDPAKQCFPSALVENDSGERTEPLASDVRKWADGKSLAKLKLVAGILGIRLDELRQRDMQRRRRNWVLISISLLSIIILTTVLALTAISNRNAAGQIRASTEELLGYMLGTLENLNPVSGLDVLDADQSATNSVIEQRNFAALEDSMLLERALSLRKEGHEALSRFDSVEARRLYSESLAGLVHLYQRDTEISEHMFELGQAEFYVGMIDLANGNLDQAEEHWTRYGVIARRLITADPKNAENVLELTYTLSNLAHVEESRVRPDHDRIIRLRQAALEYNQFAIVLEPDREGYVFEMSESQAWLADAWLGVCNLDKAYQFRVGNIEIAEDLMNRNPDVSKYKKLLAHAYFSISRVEQMMGMKEQALENMLLAETLFIELVEAAPDDERLQWQRWMRAIFKASLMAKIGDTEGAWNTVSQSMRAIRELTTDRPLTPWQIPIQPAGLRLMAYLAWSMGNESEAKRYNHQAVEALSASARSKPELKHLKLDLTRTLFQYWQLHNSIPVDELMTLIEDHSLDDPPAQSCVVADLAARQAFMRGDKETASDYTSYLLGKGYYDPAFISFCQEYDLCPNQ